MSRHCPSHASQPTEGERGGEIGRKKRRRRSLKFRIVRLEDRDEIGGRGDGGDCGEGGRMKSVCCYVHRGRWGIGVRGPPNITFKGIDPGLTKDGRGHRRRRRR